ncbi:MAG: type II toxin-antitoxin system HicA family toxin [Acidimicrobiia bacterium]
MSGKELVRILTAKFRGEIVRIRGSHHIVRVGDCIASVPVHKNRDLPTGTLKNIHRAFEPCCGKGWWK